MTGLTRKAAALVGVIITGGLMLAAVGGLLVALARQYIPHP